MRKNFIISTKKSSYAIGNAEQRHNLGNRSYLMPIVWENDNILIATIEIFYTTAIASQMRESRTFLKNHRLKHMGSYWLKDSVKKELESILPNFQLDQFRSWMFVGGGIPSYQDELIFWPCTYFNSFSQPGVPAMYFSCVSKSIQTYKGCLGTNMIIFIKPFIKPIPKPLSFCEELFDRKVLEIKKLVKDIGDLTPLIHTLFI